MKKISTILCAALAALACANSVKAALVITEVMSGSAHGGGTNNADWFELTNTGASAVDITGWTWDDDTVTTAGNFGSITSIGAGQSIIFTGETLGSEAAWITDWGISGVTVVNLGGTVFQSLSGTDGDVINISNSIGTVVTGVTFGAATNGFSFEWDTTGTSLGLSVGGQNGAFQAAQNGQTSEGPGVDIGSPGTAVPEPASATMILGGLGMTAWMFRRRKAQA